MKLDFRNDGRGVIHVHKAGCGDLRHARYERMDSQWTGDAVSQQEAVWHVYPPDDFDYDPAEGWPDYLGDLRFYPCTADLETEGSQCERCQTIATDINREHGLCPTCSSNNESRVIL